MILKRLSIVLFAAAIASVTTPHCQWLILRCLSYFVSVLFRTQITNISCAMFVVARHFHPLNKWFSSTLVGIFFLFFVSFSPVGFLFVSAPLNLPGQYHCSSLWLIRIYYIWMRCLHNVLFYVQLYFSLECLCLSLSGTLHQCTEIAKTFDSFSKFYNENVRGLQIPIEWFGKRISKIWLVNIFKNHEHSLSAWQLCAFGKQIQRTFLTKTLICSK